MFVMRRVKPYSALTSILLGGTCFAQVLPQPEFEVASVRASAPASSMREEHTPGVRTGGPGTSDPERVSFSRIPFNLILAEAFNISAHRIVGPDWIATKRYDIVAKVSPGTTANQGRLMLQSLLIERFHLVAQFQTKMVTGYELVVAAGGAKLMKTAVDGSAEPSTLPPLLNVTSRDEGFPALPPGVRQAATYSRLDERFRATFSNTSISEFAAFLGERLGAEYIFGAQRSYIQPEAIVDYTGLAGRYDFTFDYVGFPNASIDPPRIQGAIKTALDKELGLKLVEAAVPVNTLFIEHVDRSPTEN
jgi:uncharacterized protein (TIGR03435 family)